MLKKLGKKASAAPWDWGKYWVQIFFVALVIVGLLLSFIPGSAFFNYMVILVVSFMAGRFLNYRKKYFPYYLVIFGLLIGYLLGVRYGSWKVVLFLFVLGFSVSWYLHEKRILK
ncbi:hypothetical protein ACFL0W_02300 [Nanoarchaeota archaeon]